MGIWENGQFTDKANTVMFIASWVLAWAGFSLYAIF